MEENPLASSDVNELSKAMVDKFVNLNKPVQSTDDLHFYTTELFTLLLVWHNYHDSVREGDGNRVMELWKFLLVIFKKTNRKNYSIEAFTLLVQYHFLLTDRMAQQLKRSRFVNIHGCNIPCDLHLEHLNRQLKGNLRRMSSNLQATTINHRAGKSLGAVHSIDTQFSRELYVEDSSNVHHKPSHAKDVDKIVAVLEEANCFELLSNRTLKCSFNSKPLLDEMDKDDKIRFREWVH